MADLLLNSETERYMANIISDETIEYVGILAKLELSEEEKENAKKDMGEMLDYIDKLNVAVSIVSFEMSSPVIVA